VGLIYGLGSSVSLHRERVVRAQRSEEDLRQLRADVQASTGEESVTVVWGYGTSSPCFGLRFGDQYAAHIFQRELSDLCPHDWMYDVWSEEVILDDATVPIDKSWAWDILVVPVRFLPTNAANLGEVFISDVESTFGPIAYIVARRVDDGDGGPT